MPNRSRKPKSRDFNQIARSVVDKATGVTNGHEQPVKKKNAAAVALGRKGGLKGGKARAAKMTKAERSESAKKAARARWGISQD